MGLAMVDSRDCSATLERKERRIPPGFEPRLGSTVFIRSDQSEFAEHISSGHLTAKVEENSAPSADELHPLRDVLSLWCDWPESEIAAKRGDELNVEGKRQNVDFRGREGNDGQTKLPQQPRTKESIPEFRARMARLFLRSGGTQEELEQMM
jgi:hypothetical protein